MRPWLLQLMKAARSSREVLTSSSFVLYSVRMASAVAPYLLEKGGLFSEHGKLTELKEDVVKHVSLFSCDAFRDVHAVPCKVLQSKVLGTTPRLYTDTAHAGEISNDKGIDSIIFIQEVKGFLIPFYFFWIKTIHMGGESSWLFTSGEIVCNMYPVKSCGFHGNDEVLKLMVLFQYISDHGFKLFCPALCVWNGFNPDKKILAEVDGRNNVCTGANVDSDKKH